MSLSITLSTCPPILLIVPKKDSIEKSCVAQSVGVPLSALNNPLSVWADSV